MKKTYMKISELLRRFLHRLQGQIDRQTDMVLEQRHTDWGLIGSSVIIGLMVGFFIVLFHLTMIWFEGLFHKIYLLTHELTVIRFFAFPLIAALGGLMVGLLRVTAFRKVRGEGLTAVVYAVRYQHGILKGILAVRTMIQSAISISSGGGGGREAPTILIGASLGSQIGQWLRLRPEHLRILSVAGSAAAIGGIFNAPLGGIVFAVEVIVGYLNLQSFIPIVLASVMSTATARFFLGDAPLLIAPPLTVLTIRDYGLLAAAGIFTGLGAVYFLKSYRLTHIGLRKTLKRIPPVWRPALGGLMAGSLLSLLPTMLETSYDPVNQAIAGEGFWLIALLTFLLKPASAAFTIGSGGEGGTFAPVLKAGAMIGACTGMATSLLFQNISVGLYALVGSASLIAGTYYAPLTGAILIFEVCRNYELLLPLMFAAVFAVFIVKRFHVSTFNPNRRLRD